METLEWLGAVVEEEGRGHNQGDDVRVSRPTDRYDQPTKHFSDQSIREIKSKKMCKA